MSRKKAKAKSSANVRGAGKAAKVMKKSSKKAAKKTGRAATPRASATVSARARAVAALKFARTYTDKLVDGFAEDQRCYQPAMTDNHLMWTLGHLALTNQWFAGALDGRPNTCPESYNALFGYGSKPNPDPSVYPPFQEVREQYEATYNRFIKAAEAMKEADMLASAIEATGGFCKDKGELLEKAIWHEGWHSGQISSLRRAIGLPTVM